jgi:ribonuclease HI
MTQTHLEMYVDGCAKGNPGPAGAGVVVCCGDEVLSNISHYLGEKTNNEAEYRAFIFALEESLVLKVKALTVYTDSELLCRQVRGVYKVKSKNLIGLHQQAMRLILGIAQFSIHHIPREKNKGADKLANYAVKNAAQNALLK